MADGTDEGRFAAIRRPGNDLRIEDPEVFPAAAAAGYDDLIDLSAFVQPVDGRCHVLRRLKALHAHRAEQQPYGRPAPGNDVADILQRRARFAGDEADAPGVLGQRLFVLGCKETLGVQLGFQLLKGQLCRADAVREHIVDVDLKRAVPFVKGSPAADNDSHPLFGAKAQPPCIRTEHDRLDAASGIPQRKIAVAAAGILHEVGDLASESDIEQQIVGIQQSFDVLVQRRYGDHFSHKPASRAARMETPMALSLEYCPGTK